MNRHQKNTILLFLASLLMACGNGGSNQASSDSSLPPAAVLQVQAVPSAIDSPATGSALAAKAVDLTDAIAILKMIVGLDVNTGGSALTPYQAFAADVDGNGKVELSDAISVLKRIVGLETATANWIFFNGPPTVADKLNPGLPPTVSAAVSSSTNVNLVAVLRGDVVNSISYAYSWSLTSKPTGSSASLSSLTATSPSITADIAGTYVISLDIKDGISNLEKSTVTLTACNSSSSVSSPFANCNSNNGGSVDTNNTSLKITPQVVSGNRHTCVLTNIGGVKCWGGNSNGQLGTGTTCPSGAYVNEPCGLSQSIPQDVFGLTSGVVQISSSTNSERTCALKTDATVWCWGAIYLSDGVNTKIIRTNIPEKISGFTGTPIQVTADKTHSCMLMLNTTVMCWGANSLGELGNGNFESQIYPVQVKNLTGVVSVSIGPAASCAILNNGNLKCWGGMPGNGSSQSGPTSENAPVDVIAVSPPVKSVAIGRSNVCFIDAYSGLKCWGYAQNGQMPTFGTLYGFVPTPGGSANSYMPNLNNNISAVSMGELFLCVLSNSKVQCQGQNKFGALGNGISDGSMTGATLKTPTGLNDNVISISSGTYHTCALTSLGEVKCWGLGESDVLQNGNAGPTTAKTIMGISQDLMLSK